MKTTNIILFFSILAISAPVQGMMAFSVPMNATNETETNASALLKNVTVESSNVLLGEVVKDAEQDVTSVNNNIKGHPQIAAVPSANETQEHDNPAEPNLQTACFENKMGIVGLCFFAGFLLAAFIFMIISLRYLWLGTN